ncbi:FGGY-family carbohydrate kinase [Rubellimicrobium aerolatum]|uniref:FGGY-family carbohydrate kinase n=1 Tax=Rubellimicrobium aerolatum TaxID=490979 RepID=A0ABW0SHP1_9RHOB|nr:FGGY-family carbohydrate kinase [Rubellimicrobium aerolatum]MBP1807548.1 sugar (pentulose or hexulose) kinase [Rubellimicrobium aerolatum]
MSGAGGAPRIAVLDIGKTNVKVVLVDGDTLHEVAVRRSPNRPRTDGPYPHADVTAQWDFFLAALRDLATEGPVDAVSITAHGATAALVAGDDLALPVLDYEFDGPDSLAADYDAERPPFAETGSARLPHGLNVGAQLHWLDQRFPEAFARATALLMWPQYWSWRLTGVLASEVTSLGCHTDLWDPWNARPSSLAVARSWDRLLPPLRRAGDVLGPIRPELAAATGLPNGTPVLCGIHDSNASLLPHLLGRESPFSVVSTGTWVVCMAVGAQPRTLDPARDVLVNVNALGDPVPSARFMGGREYETIRQGRSLAATDEDRAAVLRDGIMLLPSVERGSGPFPGRASRWTHDPATEGQTGVALSWYLGLMTATCLDLIGAQGDVVVEGPFAANPEFLSMLATATGRPVLASEGNASGTSTGAALLRSGHRPPEAARRHEPDPQLRAYADRWSLKVVGAT